MHEARYGPHLVLHVRCHHLDVVRQLFVLILGDAELLHLARGMPPAAPPLVLHDGCCTWRKACLLLRCLWSSTMVCLMTLT